MALDRLTKIDGGGISTTSDYRVGIITASKFVGPFDGTGGNFSGIITASGANFSGNVSIGGTLTYEDVTNIDSVGIITARNGIDCNGDIDVDGHTNLDNVSVAGVTTFASNVNLGDNDKIILGSGNRFSIYDNGTSAIIDNTYGSGSILRLGSGNQVVLGSPLSNNQTLIRGVVNGPSELYHAGAKKLETYTSGINVTGNTVADGLTIDGDSDLNGDLDVDGHTNLDNVSIAGVTTMSGNLTISNTDPRIIFVDTNNNPDFTLHANGGVMQVENSGSGTQVKLESSGSTRLFGNIIANKDLDVDGHTNLDNVSVAGVSTFTGNIDANANFEVAGTSKLSGDVTINRTTGLLGSKLSINKDADQEGIGIQLNQSSGITTSFTTFNSAGTQTFSLAHDTDGTPDLILKLKHSTNSAPAEKVRITSGGNVNIGTGENTQTVRMLNVYGGAARVTQTSGGNTIEAFGGTTSGQSYGLLVNAGTTANDYAATFRNSGGTTLFRVRGDGNIGVGINNPSSILHVSGGSTPTILNKPTDATPALFVGDSNRTGAGQHLAEYRGNWNGTTVARMVIHAGDDTTNKDNGDITFRTAAAGSTIERVRITSDGKMGLGSGITSPIADFEIYKNSGISSCVVRGPKALLAIMGDSDNTGASETDASLMFTSDSHTILNSPLTAHGFEIALLNEEPGSGLRFHDGTNNAERLRITSNGSVLVNTTSGHGKFQVHDGTIVHSKPSGGGTRNYRFVNNNTAAGDYGIQISSTSGGSTYVNHTELKAGGDVHIHDGNLVVASGHGIDFSSTGNGSGSMTNELLDDYEEGTWTPTAHSGGSGISNISATYTRVGRIVHVQFRGYITGINGSLAQIGGLPYANWQSYAHQVGPVMHNGFDFAGSTEPTVTSYITGTNSYFQLYYSRTNSGGWVHATGNDTGGDQFITSLTYFVA